MIPVGMGNENFGDGKLCFVCIVFDCGCSITRVDTDCFLLPINGQQVTVFLIYANNKPLDFKQFCRDANDGLVMICGRLAMVFCVISIS